MDISIDELKSVFHYDKTTGVLRRNDIKSRPNCIAAYKEKAGKSRLVVSYKKRLILAHRLAWAISMGAWPDGDIDHINGNDSDNRLANLRDVSKSVNQQNKRRPRVDNKSGFMGVSWHPRAKKWRAQITVESKQIYLGVFESPEAAHRVYMSAKRRLHPGCTI